MSDSRDPAIKLFGKTIPLPPSAEEGGGEVNKGLLQNKEVEATREGFTNKDQESPNSDKKSDDPVSPMAVDTLKPSSDNQEIASEKNSKPEERQNETSNSQEKPLKKPDKILPCPRCNSLDTKFCYHNNYNVNQPRHFCKNCQRYWTAGGTMRNVPVGAGRRKNKNTVSHYRHLTVSDATLQTIRSDVPDPIHSRKPNATVIRFGSDAPLCESMASVLHLADNRNGFHRTEDEMEEQSNGSLVNSSNSTGEGTRANLHDPAIRNCQGFGHQIPYLNSSPWPYPWSPAPAIPIPVYPAAAYWGCPVPGSWTIPWISAMASSPTNGSSVSGPNSPTLGKHSREGNVLKHSNSEKGDTTPKQSHHLWIPKTLRIDDPEEAGKSSIWATMGFKNDKADTMSGSGGLFRAFQTKADLRNHTAEASQILHANPAAMSRSLNFQESS